MGWVCLTVQSILICYSTAQGTKVSKESVKLARFFCDDNTSMKNTALFKNFLTYIRLE